MLTDGKHVRLLWSPLSCRVWQISPDIGIQHSPTCCCPAAWEFVKSRNLQFRPYVRAQNPIKQRPRVTNHFSLFTQNGGKLLELLFLSTTGRCHFHKDFSRILQYLDVIRYRYKTGYNSITRLGTSLHTEFNNNVPQKFNLIRQNKDRAYWVVVESGNVLTTHIPVLRYVH